MIKRFIFAFFTFLFACSFLQAAENTKNFAPDSYTDIFISTQKADITITPDGQTNSITWRQKLCSVVFTRPSEGIITITVEPQKQNSVLKKLLMIPRSRCKIKMHLANNKNIYASSQTGDIRFFDIAPKTARAYSGQGVVETSYVGGGDFTAETLTGKINIRDYKGRDLTLKTVSGTITSYGSAEDISVLNTSGNSKLNLNADTLMFYSSQGNLFAKWEKLPTQGLNISAHSFSGNIKIYLPKMSEEYKNKSKIELKSFYGVHETEEK